MKMYCGDCEYYALSADICTNTESEHCGDFRFITAEPCEYFVANMREEDSE